jgi:hypothetical protein
MGIFQYQKMTKESDEENTESLIFTISIFIISAAAK